MIGYSIHKLSSAPRRYALHVEDQVVLTFGSATYKKFFNKFKYDSSQIKEYLNSRSDLIIQIQNFEIKIFREEMFSYLAKQETSPAKLERWLLLRQVELDKIRDWILLAQNHNFLNLERYIAGRVEKKKIQGHPWKRLEMEFKRELSSYGYLFPPGITLEEILSRYVYSDTEILKNYFKLPSRFKNHPEKLKHYLLTKGFAPSSVKEYFNSD